MNSSRRAEDAQLGCVCNGNFTCSSGECIHHSLVCNRAADCLDASDEQPAHCGYLILNDTAPSPNISYAQEVPHWMSSAIAAHYSLQLIAVAAVACAAAVY